MHLPKVIVVILTYNHLEETITTIDCFKKQVYENMAILIVDNASSDNTCPYIKENYQEIFLVENNENFGWSKGNNIGIEYALNQGADYVLLANNDLFFDDVTIISTLVRDMDTLALKYNNRLISTRQYSYFYKDKLMSEGIFYFSKSAKRNQRLNIFRNQNNSDLPKQYKKVDAIIGAFLLIKSSFFKEVGMIDEDYYFTWEDTDLCYRAWKNGFMCVVNEDLKIYHKVSTSCKTNSALSNYYRMRNYYLFLKKHKDSIPDYFRYMLTYHTKFLKNIARIIIFPSRLSDSRLRVLKATLLGYLDAVILNRKGKRY